MLRHGELQISKKPAAKAVVKFPISIIFTKYALPDWINKPRKKLLNLISFIFKTMFFAGFLFLVAYEQYPTVIDFHSMQESMKGIP